MRKLSKREQQDLMDKLDKDEETIWKYKAQMKAQRKEYSQVATAYSMTGRRNRALAVGECVLKAYDDLRELNGKKTLLDGTLFWNILEERLIDPDGRKGFRYSAIYHVKSDEQAIPDEDIEKEIDETREKIYRETGEMFGIDVHEWLDGRDDLVPRFEPDTDPAVTAEERWMERGE